MYLGGGLGDRPDKIQGIFFHSGVSGSAVTTLLQTAVVWCLVPHWSSVRDSSVMFLIGIWN